ncbi:hypothetical protein [Jiangella sp. DSM 45060]|uniref:hypothetical protein n=1 Tax=Jiangella sp. DSM 45060 TaxID=1798224 RepID=UPI00087BCFC2|nr:hypothetical protein [Jiangella sp. DSM 45060]SDT69500.1 hypothetical protein SAMN04515669_6030 [Jiangella sp. DSM 45060]
MSQTIEVESIARLDVRPGESLIVTVPNDFDAADADHVHRALRERLPAGVNVVIVQAGITFQVVAQEAPA